MKIAAWIVLALALAGCANTHQRPEATMETINAEVKDALVDKTRPAQPDAVSQALLPPLLIEMPKSGGRDAEHRFDLVVNNAPASQVFLTIVAGTRFSMVVHPDVTGNVSVNLKDVTVQEAMETLRELYGYEYRVVGTRIIVQPLTLQTRVFQVNYLQGRRSGQSETRVTSGSVSDASGSGGASGSNTTGVSSVPGSAASTPGATTATSLVSSRVTTSSQNDFWTDIANALRAILGLPVFNYVGSPFGNNPASGGASLALLGANSASGGASAALGGNIDQRTVIVSPDTGVIIVRAYPKDFRAVETFLKATRISVERQVMLEAKIISVALNDSFQAGINWSAFYTGINGRLSGGQLTPSTTLQPFGSVSTNTALAPDGTTLVNSNLTATPGQSLTSGSALAGALFGLAFQTKSFATLLSFLDSQGKTQVLSSPRVATLNNQKAVLKVGTDDFFLTNVTTTQSVGVTGAATVPSPSFTLQPFFSGIALDVTPQIDEHNNIILHVHPSVSSVVAKSQQIDLGTLGSFTLPLASSTVSETDSVVRVPDGNIVAIGGLMKMETDILNSQIPGLGDLPLVGRLFKNVSRNVSKSELVILLKPTVITGDESWDRDLLDTQMRLQDFEPPLHPVQLAPAAAPQPQK
jgi:MSHA biogenesis protein MshL